MDKVELIAKVLHDDACRCRHWPCGAVNKLDTVRQARVVAKALERGYTGAPWVEMRDPEDVDLTLTMT